MIHNLKVKEDISMLVLTRLDLIKFRLMAIWLSG